MDLTLDGQGTLYAQIARALKCAILTGALAPGSRLPSTRQLASALRVSRKSVLEAYELLGAEQLATARRGSGTHIAVLTASSESVAAAAGVKPPQSRYSARARKLGPIALAGGPVAGRAAQIRYDLQYGAPLVNLKFFNSWRRKLAAAALRAGPRYPDPAGFLPLRRALAEQLTRRRGLVCGPADIFVVGGTQQALTLAARILINEGDPVVLEDPNYQTVMHALVAHGARLIHVRTDDEGLVVSELPRASARMVYVTPSHQFPSGTTLSLQRRLELLRWARERDCWILEDDYEAEFLRGRKHLPALKSLDTGDRVIYVGTFSKALFPSLRLGYVVSPKGLREDFRAAKRLDDLGSPVIEQSALATFIQSRQYDKHLRSSYHELDDRRRVLLEALRHLVPNDIEISRSCGAMHLAAWLRRLNFARCDTLIERAAERGLGLHPLHPYYHVRPPRPGLLLGFAGLSSSELRSAVGIFDQCLREA